jgi:hypothetical protein
MRPDGRLLFRVRDRPEGSASKTATTHDLIRAIGGWPTKVQSCTSFGPRSSGCFHFRPGGRFSNSELDVAFRNPRGSLGFLSGYWEEDQWPVSISSHSGKTPMCLTFRRGVGAAIGHQGVVIFARWLVALFNRTRITAVPARIFPHHSELRSRLYASYSSGLIVWRLSRTNASKPTKSTL